MQEHGEAAPSPLGNEIISKMHFPVFLVSTQIQHLEIPSLTEMQLYPPVSHRDKHGDGYDIFRGNNDSAFPPLNLAIILIRRSPRKTAGPLNQL